MNGREDTFWELKQAAKWSLGLSERRRAINELAKTYRGGAIHALLEIKNTAVHEEIRQACMDAIKSVASKATTRSKPKKKAKSTSKRVRRSH
jgi:hypothetical protein